MTKQPHLKDRIRARMADTGESYMTARRHVVGPVARHGAPPPSRWRHLPGVHPQTTVARTLLANAGVRGGDGDISEALLLGLSGGIGLGVYESRYEAEDYSSLYVTPRQLSDDLAFVTDPLERAGAQSVVEQPGARAAEANLRAALEHGPVAAWLDLAEAGYAALPAMFSGGGYHVVAVLDHDGHRAILGDVAEQPIEIDAARLAAARARIKKYKARTARVDGPPDAIPYEALVQRGLETSVERMTAPPRGSGPVALDRLVAAMRDTDLARAWSTRFRPGANLARALTGLDRFIEAWGTGGGFLRPLFASFLDEAAGTLGNAGLSEAAAAYRHAGRGWTLLAETATTDEVPPLAAFREAEAERAEARAAGAIPPAQSAAFADAVTAAEAEAATWLAEHPVIATELVRTVADLVEDVAARERAAGSTFLAAASRVPAGPR